MAQLLVDPDMYLQETQTWVTIHQEVGILKTLLGFEVLSYLNRQFLSSNGSIVFGKETDLCQVRCPLDNKFLRVNRLMILLEDNLMTLYSFSPILGDGQLNGVCGDRAYRQISV